MQMRFGARYVCEDRCKFWERFYTYFACFVGAAVLKQQAMDTRCRIFVCRPQLRRCRSHKPRLRVRTPVARVDTLWALPYLDTLFHPIYA